MTSDDSNKRTSFLDRLSGKVSDGFKSSPGDIIHEGISDDELDKLLSADIKSTSRPPTNPSGPAEYTESQIKELDSENQSGLSTVFKDAMTEEQASETSSDDAHAVNLVSNDALNSAVSDSDMSVTVDEVVESSAVELTDDMTIDAPELTAAPPSISISGVGATSAGFNRNKSEDKTSSDIASEPLNIDETQDETSTDNADVEDMVFTKPDDVELSDNLSALDAEEQTADTDSAIDAESSEAMSDEVTETDITLDTDSSSEQSVTTSIVSTETADLEADESAVVDDNATATTMAAATTAVLSSVVDEDDAITSSSDSPSNDTKSDDASDNTDAAKDASEFTDNTSSNKPSNLLSTSGNNTMTDANQNNLIEKVQTDIDELKRKIHSMSTEYFTAATDSAALLGQVRELDTGSTEDFTGTYTQTRELRKLLIDARKIFTELPTTLDLLEEALENDLYTAKK